MVFVPKTSLYIHIPWCVKKCPYCDFNTYLFKQSIDSKIYYMNILIQDLKNDIKLIKNRTIQTIFIGGGTPNIIHYSLLNCLINNIKKNIQITKNAEISIEINPDHITIEEIFEYIKIGINRISIGVQSFNDNMLEKIGRTHSANQSIKIITAIQKYTKINLNIDLMYGLPNQTLQECLFDLNQAIKLYPNHISWYQLSIEKNTIFYYKNVNIPQESTLWKMYYQGNKLLTQAKYKRYEISSYALHKNFCRHNLNYWNFGDYIGIGCGAHGKITKKNGEIIRTIKKKTIQSYCQSNQTYIETMHNIPNKDKPLEYFMNLFRLFKPISKKNFVLHTQIQIKDIQKYVQKAIFHGYIKENQHHWHVKNKGRNFLNDLIMVFI